ncbi:hypothetical protein KX816_08860 [Sphingosinicellaceae bacterium]|nr:hypothetical protein KX816_08860 [Sphingosinicellaceae bacterium]
MNRLARLRTIRTVELNRGLRSLADAQRRVGQLADMQFRIGRLGAELPAGDTVGARKAASAGLVRLDEAAGQVATALDGVRGLRDGAMLAAARLRVRVDVVDQAMARR